MRCLGDVDADVDPEAEVVAPIDQCNAQDKARPPRRDPDGQRWGKVRSSSSIASATGMPFTWFRSYSNVPLHVPITRMTAGKRSSSECVKAGWVKAARTLAPHVTGRADRERQEHRCRCQGLGCFVERDVREEDLVVRLAGARGSFVLSRL